ncbi:SelT/SelW/SelH family protein [Paractinoplanes maris]|uniref:SelT/SelW/SelH family protein n=1 Tax=Paractinoplanes maris TaxID=1734446 RepID=UPI0020206716|nr:SelT/SelW/SelH family protein [Actinoplanes maris]
MTRRPRLEIEYCTQCRWLLRAAWTAQELLTTFQKELGEVALVPGTGGVFEIRLDEELLWSRRESGFPELPELKRLVRDRIAPGRSLGHTDRASEDRPSDHAGQDAGNAMATTDESP